LLACGRPDAVHATSASPAEYSLFVGRSASSASSQNLFFFFHLTRFWTMSRTAAAGLCFWLSPRDFSFLPKLPDEPLQSINQFILSLAKSCILILFVMFVCVYFFFFFLFLFATVKVNKVVQILDPPMRLSIYITASKIAVPEICKDMLVRRISLSDFCL